MVPLLPYSLRMSVVHIVVAWVNEINLLAHSYLSYYILYLLVHNKHKDDSTIHPPTHRLWYGPTTSRFPPLYSRSHPNRAHRRSQHCPHCSWST